jgi:hypothetical protein
MSAERGPINSRNTKRLPIAARVVALAGIAIVNPGDIHEEVQVDPFETSQTSKTYNLSSEELADLQGTQIEMTYVAFESQGQEKKKDNNDFSDFLEDKNIRILLATTAAYSVISAINAKRLGAKFDEKKLEALRVAGPALLTASVATLGIDSLTSADIDPRVPVALFTASTLFMAAHNIVNTFEREKDLKARGLALATSTALVTVGIAALNVADKIE